MTFRTAILTTQVRFSPPNETFGSRPQNFFILSIKTNVGEDYSIVPSFGKGNLCTQIVGVSKEATTVTYSANFKGAQSEVEFDISKVAKCSLRYTGSAIEKDILANRSFELSN